VGGSDDLAVPFSSSTDKYVGQATMNNICDFITMIKMVIDFADGGEEIYFPPVKVVMGPPVVLLQSSFTMSPSNAGWLRDRFYPLLFPLQHESPLLAS
jgi:hypothetical protein